MTVCLWKWEYIVTKLPENVNASPNYRRPGFIWTKCENFLALEYTVIYPVSDRVSFPMKINERSSAFVKRIEFDFVIAFNMRFVHFCMQGYAISIQRYENAD